MYIVDVVPIEDKLLTYYQGSTDSLSIGYRHNTVVLSVKNKVSLSMYTRFAYSI